MVECSTACAHHMIEVGTVVGELLAGRVSHAYIGGSEPQG